MIKLYQFPISHYCEKVRWALEYKKITYKTINLVAGSHLIKTKSLGMESTLPIIVHDNNTIQGSAEIITYLDQHFPENLLTPSDPASRKEVLFWESYADREIGPQVRLLCYHTLLDHRDIVVPMMAKNGPWHGKLLLKIAFPKIADAMRKMMNINDVSADQARVNLSTCLDKLSEALDDGTFIVGDRFSRADLSIAALLAPLTNPKRYGEDWPDTIPEPLASDLAGFQGGLSWVNHMYDHFR